MKDVFQKIATTVPSRKYKQLIEICHTASEEVEKDTELKADKYFYIMKMGLETGLPRLMNAILDVVIKLYNHDCLIGDCPDNCVYPPGKTPSAKNGRLPRQLIDAIAETIMECSTDNDNTV